MKEPEPGRPRQLGTPMDDLDAQAVLDIARACRSASRAGSRAAAMRVLREALWFLWEEPRLPRPLVASKYPRSYPWPPVARARLEEHAGNRPQGGWGLVIEHLYPRELLVGYLLDEGAEWEATDAVALLTTRLMAAIVTRDEDRQLPTRAKSARPWDDYRSDPWLRYHASGLRLDEFGPLT